MVSLYFGLPGCGKTTFLTKIAQQELKKIKRKKSNYTDVFCNFYCKGTKRLDYKKDFGIYQIENALILIDEASLEQDSRDFKTLTFEKKQALLLHRHYGNDIIFSTQQYNGVDLKIRNIVQKLYYCRKIAFFTIAYRVPPAIVFPEATGEIVQGYQKPSFLQKWLTLKICFRPFYYKFFNSFDAPILKYKEWALFD